MKWNEMKHESVLCCDPEFTVIKGIVWYCSNIYMDFDDKSFSRKEDVFNHEMALEET